MCISSDFLNLFLIIQYILLNAKILRFVIVVYSLFISRFFKYGSVSFHMNSLAFRFLQVYIHFYGLYFEV